MPDKYLTNMASVEVPLTHIGDGETISLEGNLLDKIGKFKIFVKMS